MFEILSSILLNVVNYLKNLTFSVGKLLMLGILYVVCIIQKQTYQGAQLYNLVGFKS